MNNIISWQRGYAWRIGIAMLLMSFAIHSAWAQISIDGTKTSLGRVLEQIKTQSNYQFFYQDRLASTSITPVKLRNASLQEVLQQVLKGTNISFTVDENIVFLSEVKSVLPVEEIADGIQTITGRVVDEEGEPLIGANVLIMGSTLGVTTNLDGSFLIQTSEAAPNLVITSIGYKPQTIADKLQPHMLITMQTEMQQIEEVVVTALGIKRAVKALSYNAQEIGHEELIRVKDGNLINSLSGRAAGVTVNGGSSGVGGASKVVMRGTKGIDQSSN
ncbi:MAG: carboxypeptidase-like regulatory domain-containing protein, partial [Phocaeicola sp.]